MKVWFSYNPHMVKLGKGIIRFSMALSAISAFNDYKWVSIGLMVIGAVGDLITFLYGKSSK